MFSPLKGTSLAEKPSFDVLIDKSRPVVFAAVGDKKKRKKERKGK